MKQKYDLTAVSTQEIFELLDAAIDGIDGYESESGELRYWNESKIERARSVIDEVKDRSGIPLGYPIPESVLSELSELEIHEYCIPK